MCDLNDSITNGHDAAYWTLRSPCNMVKTYLGEYVTSIALMSRIGTKSCAAVDHFNERLFNVVPSCVI